MATVMEKSSHEGGLVNEAVVYEVSHYVDAQTVMVSGHVVDSCRNVLTYAVVGKRV